MAETNLQLQRHKVREYVYDYSTYDFPDSLDGFIEDLNRLKKEHADKTLNLESDLDDEGSYESHYVFRLKVYYFRPETDAEMEYRIEKWKRFKMTPKERELEQLAILKAKYPDA